MAGGDALTDDLSRGFPGVADGEQATFDLFGREIPSVIAGWKPCESEGERHQIKEFTVASLHVGLFGHG